MCCAESRSDYILSNMPLHTYEVAVPSWNTLAVSELGARRKALKHSSCEDDTLEAGHEGSLNIILISIDASPFSGPMYQTYDFKLSSLEYSSSSQINSIYDVVLCY